MERENNQRDERAKLFFKRLLFQLRLSKRTIQKMIVSLFFFIMLETVGNFLLFCQIHFERYIMDPQKRTISNQLFSGLCIATITHNLLVVPGCFIRLNGLIDEHISYLWLIFGITGFLLYAILTITEMTIIKFIYIQSYHKIAILNEYFISSLLEKFNIFFVSLCLFVRFYLKADTSNGKLQNTVKMWSSWFPVIFCIGLISTFSLMIFIIKKKSLNRTHPDIEMGNLPTTNEAQNPQIQNQDFQFQSY